MKLIVILLTFALTACSNAPGGKKNFVEIKKVTSAHSFFCGDTYTLTYVTGIYETNGRQVEATHMISINKAQAETIDHERWLGRTRIEIMTTSSKWNPFCHEGRTLTSFKEATRHPLTLTQNNDLSEDDETQEKNAKLYDECIEKSQRASDLEKCIKFQ